MAKKRARSKSTPSTATKRPVAPSFELAPPRSEAVPAADSLAPVSTQLVAMPTVDVGSSEPVRETSGQPETAAFVAETDETPEGAPPSRERLTVPELPQPRTSEHAVALGHDDDAADLFFASAEAAVAREAAAELEAARRSALEEAAAAMPPPAPPEVLARRRMLRRAVSAVVGAAAVFAMIAGVSVTQARAGKKVAPVVAAAFVDAPAPRPSFIAPSVAEAPVTEIAQAAPPKAEPAVAPEQALPAAEPIRVEPVAAEPAAEKVVDAAAAKALTKETLGLLERGAFAKAIEKAQASIDADPSDAAPYLYWGTALMETGKRVEAKQVFAKCVEQATRGPKHECAQFKLRRANEGRVCLARRLPGQAPGTPSSPFSPSSRSSSSRCPGPRAPSQATS